MAAWILAGLTALLALGFAGWGARMRAARERSELRFQGALQAARDLQTQLDEQRGTVVVGALAGEIGGRLQAAVEQAAMRASPRQDSAAALLARYQQQVHEYDRAVEYCLQPVDLISAADGATLEQLLRHVTEARRRLFRARMALMQSRVPTQLATLLAVPKADRTLDRGLAAALGRMASGSGERARHTPADVNALLSAALVLTQARCKRRNPAIKRLEALPPLAPAPWLGPILLQLLHCAVAAAGHEGRLIARTIALPRRIEVHIIGHLATPGVGGGSAVRCEAREQVAELRRQLDRYGASLIEMRGHDHGLGLVLRLPVRVVAIAKAA